MESCSTEIGNKKVCSKFGLKCVVGQAFSVLLCEDQLLVSLQELNREEPAGLGGPNCERYVLDSRGALVERQAVVYRERLILGHCLVLSILVVRTGKLNILWLLCMFTIYNMLLLVFPRKRSLYDIKLQAIWCGLFIFIFVHLHIFCYNIEVNIFVQILGF